MKKVVAFTVLGTLLAVALIGGAVAAVVMNGGPNKDELSPQGRVDLAMSECEGAFDDDGEFKAVDGTRFLTQDAGVLVITPDKDSAKSEAFAEDLNKVTIQYVECALDSLGAPGGALDTVKRSMGAELVQTGKYDWSDYRMRIDVEPTTYGAAHRVLIQVAP